MKLIEPKMWFLKNCRVGTPIDLYTAQSTENRPYL